MSYADRDGVIWADGKLVPWREANTHLLTHSLHYGVGAFEGIRAYKTDQGTAIFRLDDHVRRLFDTCRILGMKMTFDEPTVRDACVAAVRENKLETAYLRPLAYYGSEGMGLHASTLSVHVVVAAWYWGAYLGGDALEKGIRIKTSSFTRHHVNSVLSKAKATGNYINSIMALQEVAKDGYDEALLLDHEGMVAEGSGENIFMVRRGTLYTPEPTCALEGITRDTVMQLAREFGIPVVEKRFARDEIYIAEECFFTGTAAEVTPIRELDNRPIGPGLPGPVTKKLQNAYLDLVQGKRAAPEGWLTLVG
ncbi:MAG: branched-chain amino acid transaminase [Gammaproteobacteria bacterium]|nr:branched-chain amino acid transaminase [Gammaproteobacteria bacterium]MBI5616322.1 branched-chain amino acid transaminase [Gammaproteobacteria bacterium]